jgi:hypothetical protein
MRLDSLEALLNHSFHRLNQARPFRTLADPCEIRIENKVVADWVQVLENLLLYFVYVLGTAQFFTFCALQLNLVDTKKVVCHESNQGVA